MIKTYKKAMLLLAFLPLAVSCSVGYQNTAISASELKTKDDVTTTGVSFSPCSWLISDKTETSQGSTYQTNETDTIAYGSSSITYQVRTAKSMNYETYDYYYYTKEVQSDNTYLYYLTPHYYNDTKDPGESEKISAEEYEAIYNKPLTVYAQMLETYTEMLKNANDYFQSSSQEVKTDTYDVTLVKTFSQSGTTYLFDYQEPNNYPAYELIYSCQYTSYKKEDEEKYFVSFFSKQEKHTYNDRVQISLAKYSFSLYE